MNEILWPLVAVYLVVVIGIGVWSARKRVTTYEDMTVAGRGVGPFLIGCSVAATWINGVTLITVTGFWEELRFERLLAHGRCGNWNPLARDLSRPPDVETPGHHDPPDPGTLLRSDSSRRGLDTGNATRFRGYRRDHRGDRTRGLYRTRNSAIFQALILTYFVTVLYVTLGGMWAVLVTDTIQFFIIVLGTEPAAHILNSGCRWPWWGVCEGGRSDPFFADRKLRSS